MKLEGLPEIIQVDEEIEMTCTVIKIKPQAAYVEWDVEGKKIYGKTTTTTNTDGRTFHLRNIVSFK